MMKNTRVKLFCSLPLVCLLVLLSELALVAKCTEYVEHFEQINQDVKNEELMFYYKTPLKGNESVKGGLMTSIPNVGITTAEPHVVPDLDLQDEWLIPGQIAEEDLILNRDKRAVFASGEDPIVYACLSLDFTFDAALSDSNSAAFQTFQTNTEAALLSECKPSLSDLSSVTVNSFDVTNSLINFQFTFTASKDIKGSAQCLRNIQERTYITINNVKYTVTKDPFIANAADQNVAAVCMLCDAQVTCLKDLTGLFYCGLSSLFPYGVTSSDTALASAEEGFSDSINFVNGIPFGTTLEYNAYISINGFLSFIPTAGPVSNILADINFDVISPFWTDIDTTNSGTVYHHLYTEDKPIATATQAVHDRATSEVNRFASRVDFKSSNVLIVTWDKVLKTGTTNVDKTITFQLVLITDGVDAYIIMFYENFKWDVVNGLLVTIGFGSGITATVNPFSGNSNVFSMATTNGNTGHNGMWFYKVGSKLVRINYASLCTKFHSSQASSKNDLKAKNSDVPACPCSKRLLTFSDVIFIISLDRTCYIRDIFMQFGTYSRLCCYAPNSDELLVNNPLSGSLLKYSPVYNPLQYFAEDFTPWDNCCIKSTRHCNLFYQVRPKQKCTTSATSNFVFGFGDPHIISLDGKSFTFNGLGEYLLLQIDSSALNFTIQMRTAKALNDAGKEVSGTVYAAFAGKQIGGGSFQIEMSPARDRLIIYFNGKDVTVQFHSKSDYTISEAGQVTLRKKSQNTVQVFFANDISMEVKLNFKMLELGLAVSTAYKTKTSGLVGNYDGDKTNDLISRSGQTIADTTDDQAIFAVAKTWVVSKSDSCFLYQDGFSYTDYNFPNFTPFFMSTATTAEKTAAAKACGNSTSTACMYDYLATGSQQIATNSKDAETQANLDIVALENKYPTLTADNTTVMVKVGEKTQITLTKNDENAGDTVTINEVETPTAGYSFTAATGIVEWTPTNTDSTNLTFQAADNKGGKSPELRIEIILCSLCSGNGSCHATEIRENGPSANIYFKLLVCVCINGFEGADCENEANACLVKPCFPLQTCTDKAGATPTGQVGYSCSPCPTGYTANGTKCVDNNECSNSNGGCLNSVCVNTIGSFTCKCNSGYRLIDNVCVDVNECIDRTHDCDQLCNNTEGSFDCSCKSGFTLQANNTCTANANGNCARTNCTYECDAEVCFCINGKKLADDGISCIDIDECTVNICAQKCNNTDPGFICSCYDGYKLTADKISCQVCDNFMWGPECQNTCDCKGHGTCNAVSGCICNGQWLGTDCSIDVDECTVNPNICGTGLICSNIPGSFECICPTGYNKVGTECQDINECNDAVKNKCSQTCVNTPGSFICTCLPGYQDNNGNCQDVDECSTETHGCEQICINTVGSYNCFCNFGFQMQIDRKACVIVASRDPCSNTLNCEYGCRLNNSVAQCFCKSGYFLDLSGLTCQDINECQGSHGCSGSCENTAGSYTCKCPAGMTLGGDERTCQDCQTNTWGANCVNSCDCNSLGSSGCNKVTGCTCNAGWGGTTCNEDNDECSIPNSCTATNSLCMNTQGSFVCYCPTGFTLSADKSKCEDVDECNSVLLNTCDQLCSNNDGSFLCSCFPGFIRNMTTNTCEDIDECSTSVNMCEQTCRNIQGSFTCDCFTGYKLNEDRTNCTAETACDASTTCAQDCSKINSVDTCGCQSGYTVNGPQCDNIDECTQSPCINGNCVDKTPFFTCDCSNGFKLQEDGITCSACPEGSYGANCGFTCTCSSINTISCNKDTGACNCKSGWKGDNCTMNIDECVLNNTLCSSIINSACKDTPGSAICQCKIGFFKTNGICQACDNTHFGQDCGSSCTCTAENTDTCNKVTGVCACKTGWMGSICDSDINECVPLNTCSSANQNQCQNTNGSFECNCNTGYTKTSSTTCGNTNECLFADLNTCTKTGEKCTDTIGTFKCDCKDGYIKNQNVCQDIDECILNNGKGDCKEICFNTEGSFNCSCPIGQELNQRDKVSCFVVEATVNQSMTIRLDITDKDSVVQNSQLVAHQQLKDSIATAVFNYLKTRGGTGVIDVYTISLSLGSVIANINLLTSNFTSEGASVLSKALYDLVQSDTLTINGSPKNVLSITKEEKTFTKNSSRCEILDKIKPCESTHVCEVHNDHPMCRLISETEGTNLPLIIGLSAGIPLFFLLIGILACLIYVCIKRRAQNKDNSDRAHTSEPRDPFQSVFSGQVPKRGGWAASRYGLYSPDTLSAASGGSDDSDDKLLKSRQKAGRMDFKDSAWNDNRSFSGPSYTTQDNGNGTSNFSWEHMFRALEPMRNFEIQRPHIQATPVNPINGRRPDSMA